MIGLKGPNKGHRDGVQFTGALSSALLLSQCAVHALACAVSDGTVLTGRGLIVGYGTRGTQKGYSADALMVLEWLTREKGVREGHAKVTGTECAPR